MKKRFQRFTAVVLSAVMMMAVPMAAHAATVSDFIDVQPEKWYYSAVEYATDNGLFSGTSSTTFSPNGAMTRGMFVTVLGRKAGVEESQYLRYRFADVKTGDYYAPYVEWAAAYGIVNGTSNTKFSPNGKITREQMASILYRYAEKTENDITYTSEKYDTFPDTARVSSYAKKGMQWAVSQGIINGNDGKLDPKGTATRAQVAKVFMSSRDILVKTEITAEPIEPEELPEIIYPQYPLTGNKVKDLINQSPLMPLKTGTPVDDRIDFLFGKILNDKMTTYDKVKACYDWLILNCSYSPSIVIVKPDGSLTDSKGNPLTIPKYRPIKVDHSTDIPQSMCFDTFEDYENACTRELSEHDSRIVTNSYVLFGDKAGVCDDFSSAFVVMTRRIGLESYVVCGQLSGEGHVWVNIKLNGQYYLFDPQVERNIAIANNNTIPYSLFCKSTHPSGFAYVYNEQKEAPYRIADFNCFRDTAVSE